MAETIIERFERRIELLEAAVADLRIQQGRINQGLVARVGALENKN